MKPKHIHFMGIGGSAMAGVAILAKKFGFQVSGCDLQKETAYSQSLTRFGIKPFVGHNLSHLKDVDILAISPAVLASNPNHPEVLEAKKQGILMSWQEFQGKYLQKDKIVIAIAGTHGKSTVTAMVGLILESGELDPIVEVGALVPQWKATVRFGQSKYFVCEADEFNHNFLNYSSGMIIINNLEMDHPEFFKNEIQFREAFKKFIKKIKKPKILIVNEESLGIQELLKEMKGWLAKEKVRVLGYFLKSQFNFPFATEYQGEIIQQTPELTQFKVRSETFNLKIPGVHNVANALGAIACGRELGISSQKIKTALGNFIGLGRRFELIGEEKGIKVFDDYAVHPTAVEATLKAARQKYPQQKIWAVFEPHQYSRLKIFLNEFAQTLKKADQVIVTAIYPGREKIDPTIKSEDLVDKIGAKAEYLKDFKKVAGKISQKAQKDDVIIVFGAGKSYLLSKMILEKLK